jgi:homoserine kinase
MNISVFLLMDCVKVVAPATSANLGAGFDIFGIALREPSMVVEVCRSSDTVIEVVGVYSEDVPVGVEENTAGVVARLMGCPVRVRIHASIPPSSGLGSSAAPAAATALAIKTLYNTPHTLEELVWIAAEGEVASAGTAHADNVAPALFGGFNIVHGRRIVTMHPENVGIVVVHPEVKISTKKARSILPENISMRDFVFNAGSAAFMTAGMLQGDVELIGLGMENHVIEPLRSQFIPGYEDVKKAALRAGAAGVTISGSGPSMIAVCRLERRGQIAEAMRQAFAEHSIACTTYKTTIGGGAEVVVAH